MSSKCLVGNYLPFESMGSFGSFGSFSSLGSLGSFGSGGSDDIFGKFHFNNTTMPISSRSKRQHSIDVWENSNTWKRCCLSHSLLSPDSMGIISTPPLYQNQQKDNTQLNPYRLSQFNSFTRPCEYITQQQFDSYHYDKDYLVPLSQNSIGFPVFPQKVDSQSQPSTESLTLLNLQSIPSKKGILLKPGIEYENGHISYKIRNKKCKRHNKKTHLMTL